MSNGTSNGCPVRVDVHDPIGHVSYGVDCLKTSGAARFSVQWSTSWTLSSGPASGLGFDYPTVKRVVSRILGSFPHPRVAPMVFGVLDLTKPWFGPEIRRARTS